METGSKHDFTLMTCWEEGSKGTSATSTRWCRLCLPGFPRSPSWRRGRRQPNLKRVCVDTRYTLNRRCSAAAAAQDSFGTVNGKEVQLQGTQPKAVCHLKPDSKSTKKKRSCFRTSKRMRLLVSTGRMPRSEVPEQAHSKPEYRPPGSKRNR